VLVLGNSADAYCAVTEPAASRLFGPLYCVVAHVASPRSCACCTEYREVTTYVTQYSEISTYLIQKFLWHTGRARSRFRCVFAGGGLVVGGFGLLVAAAVVRFMRGNSQKEVAKGPSAFPRSVVSILQLFAG
jgi:hypothetical protein